MLPSELAVEKLPAIYLSKMQAIRIAQGVATTVPTVCDGIYRLYAPNNVFFGIGKYIDQKIKAEKILFQPNILSD